MNADLKVIKENSAACPGPLEKTTAATLPTKEGTFKVVAFGCPITKDGHVALVIGEPAGKGAILARVHSECLTGDVFGSLRCDCGEQLRASMKMLALHGTGVLLYLKQEGRGIGIVNKIRAYHLQENGADTVEANRLLGFPADLRDYRCAACMLKEMSITSVRLITNNPDKIEGLRKHGIDVVERVPLVIPPNEMNRDYMKTKFEVLHHLISFEGITKIA